MTNVAELLLYLEVHECWVAERVEDSKQAIIYFWRLVKRRANGILRKIYEAPMLYEKINFSRDNSI